MKRNTVLHRAGRALNTSEVFVHDDLTEQKGVFARRYERTFRFFHRLEVQFSFSHYKRRNNR
ncbi:hypothetical protein DV713_13445 [Parageobacillus thermoglucosidasius]|nr:hypothetical protein DV713_13445 [Parageobacillus thermoglucosidasius]